MVFPEPKFRKSQIASFIPEILRGFRYPTYVTGQTEWDDSPLYLFDEWSAYVNGGATGVEMVEKNLYKNGWTDGVSGCLEFSIYAAALCLALEKYDSEYAAANPDFLVFVKWQLKRSKAIYDKGSVMSQFKWEKQDAMLKNLGSAQAADLMVLLKDIWN